MIDFLMYGCPSYMMEMWEGKPLWSGGFGILLNTTQRSNFLFNEPLYTRLNHMMV